MEYIVQDQLKPIHVDEYYFDWLSDVFSNPVDICGIEMDPVTIFKEMDPIAYDCGKSDMIGVQIEDGFWFEVNGEYYEVQDLEDILSND